jgi:hypothetical protein
MAAAATGAVKARPQARSRFNIACDGMYLLEGGASVSEILGVDAGDTRACACGSRPNSRVNSPNWRFGATTQAGCGASDNQRNALTDKRALHVSIKYYLRMSPERRLSFTVVMSSDIANVGGTTWANAIGNPNAGGAKTIYQWFNTAAFVAPNLFSLSDRVFSSLRARARQHQKRAKPVRSSLPTRFPRAR